MIKTEKKALKKENKFKKKIKKKDKKRLKKNKKTHLNDLNEEKNDFSFLEEEDEISPELDQFLKDQEEAEIEEENENNYDDVMGNWEEEDEIEETEEDPLKEFEGGNDTDEEEGEEQEEAPTEKIADVKERISSEKNRKNLSRIGAKVLDKTDILKAKFCSKISGLHLAEYVSDDETKELLIECIGEYLATKDVQEISPFGALMAALALWTLPPLGVALLDRFQLKKEDRPSFTTKKKKTSTKLNPPTAETATEEENEEAEGEAKTDYSHLKEFQEQRKIFKTHSNGNYQRTKDGTYIGVDIADEAPSPEVQELIDQGYKDRKIRKILGYG